MDKKTRDLDGTYFGYTLDHLESLDQAATPPPWNGAWSVPSTGSKYAIEKVVRFAPGELYKSMTSIDGGKTEFDVCECRTERGSAHQQRVHANMELIEAARNVMPYLIARIRELEAQVKQLKGR